MLSVAEALSAIIREAEPFEPTEVALADALGLVLAADAASDIDSPPFDKSLLDGYAVRASDFDSGCASLAVLEEVTAGRVPTKPIGKGQATRIMTGAPLPDGADAVVRIEDSEFDAPSKTVRIATNPLAAGANIMRRGSAMRQGDLIVPDGQKLRPQELGALAEMGKHRIAVRRAPRVAVLATGDELVPIDATPGPGQIRNSNETMLIAQTRAAGASPVPLGIVRDERDRLRERIRAGLECDVLILSGGVSAGTFDLVPSELAAAGVRQVFHKVNLKPGKPIWFGRFDSGQSSAGGSPTGRCYVFGLPGNPVGSMVCFELFVRTAIRRLMGVPDPAPQSMSARLATSHSTKSDRPTYHPARLAWREGAAHVEPIDWLGSGDLCATVEANAMVLFAAGKSMQAAGEMVDVYVWD